MEKKLLFVVILASVLGGCSVPEVPAGTTTGDGSTGDGSTGDGSTGGSTTGGSTTGGSTTVENASICFNNDLYTKEAKYTLTWNKGTQSNVKEQYRVIGDAVYRGQSATEMNINGSDLLLTGKTYSIINNDEKKIYELGAKNSTREVYYEPALLTRFDINKGESYEQNTTLIANVGTFKSEMVIVGKTTFKGLETITVPAGTYHTCKFETGGSITPPSGIAVDYISTYWYAVTLGIPVKKIDNKSTFELTEADINGTAM